VTGYDYGLDDRADDAYARARARQKPFNELREELIAYLLERDDPCAYDVSIATHKRHAHVEHALRNDSCFERTGGKHSQWRLSDQARKAARRARDALRAAQPAQAMLHTTERRANEPGALLSSPRTPAHTRIRTAHRIQARTPWHYARFGTAPNSAHA
jgi:hypothetical protein